MWPVLHKQLCQISRCQATQTFEGKQGDLIVNPFRDGQPMQAPRYWCNKKHKGARYWTFVRSFDAL